ncbi:MAG: amidohydrolase family protein [Burkholderiales bacterium]|nr:amidohydrolase family protein [Burkholderiales bacterium]
MAEAALLLRGGSVWEGGEQPAFPADVLIRGRRIEKVHPTQLRDVKDARCLDIGGHTVIPGLVEGHAHLPFAHKANIADTGDIPPEEHTLLTLLHARKVLDAGFTSCLSGGSAKPRLDIAVRDFINAGHAPGPRLLAASPELTNTGNLGDERRLHLYRESIAMVVDGADEMLRTVRLLIREGVDTIKLNVSGNQTIPNARSHITVMREDELATAVETAHAHGKRVAAHVRAAASIKLALKHGVDILYHCEYADDECIDLMEGARDRIFVAPAIGLLYALLHEAEPWGITHEKAAATGVADQFEQAQRVFPELRKRGVRVLVGGDYGFPWTPHGTNARDLEYFVRFLGYSNAEALRCATSVGAQAMLMEGQTGHIRDGYLADLLVVTGEPQNDVRLLQSAANLKLVVKDGEIHGDRLTTRH